MGIGSRWVGERGLAIGEAGFYIALAVWCHRRAYSPYYCSLSILLDFLFVLIYLSYGATVIVKAILLP